MKNGRENFLFAGNYDVEKIDYLDAKKNKM